MPDFTLLDIQQKNGSAVQRQIVEDVIADTPTIKNLPAKVVDKVTFNFIRKVGIPRGRARAVNEGTNTAVTEYTRHTGNCGLYDTIITIDKALADWVDTDVGNLMTDEAHNRIAGMMMSWEYQLYYGKHVEGKGFDGFNQQIGDKMTISADPVIDKAGTNTPGGMSVWLVREKANDISLMFGKSRAISFGAITEETTHDKLGKPYKVKTQDAHAWVGLAVMSETALGRIRNISTDHPLTDDLLAKAMMLFPSSGKPTKIYMNKAAGRLLQTSRTGTLKFVKGTSGSTTSADWPTDYMGIPIEYTDGLISDETEENIKAIADASMVYMEKNGTIDSRETIEVPTA